MTHRVYAAGAAVLLTVALGCTKPQGFRPIETDSILLWDRQTTETRELLLQITGEFNASRQGLPVKVEYSGGYSDIFRKVTASIQAGSLPAIAVAYESMTSGYVQAGAVAPMDPFIHDPQIGMSEADLADIFPAIIQTNTYAQFDNKMYSFPFCKSVLMMYFNKRVLEQAGLSGPPKTWDEFLEQCRAIKAKTGKKAYAVSVDASTIDAVIFSLGGEVISGKQTLLDSPLALKTFELFETLGKEALAYQITPNSYEDREALARDDVAFIFRSSSHRTIIAQLMGDLSRWGMARIPQGDPQHPCTVLYGPNICIFNTTPEQERVAWEFIKFFTSPKTSVRWALGTGYLPIRKSSAEDPHLKAFWSQWEHNRAAFDCLPFARAEPNLAGWQEVRDLIEKAQTAVLTGVQTAKDAAPELKRKADAVLQSP